MSAPSATLPASSPKFPSPLQRVRLGVKTPLPRVLESAPEGIQMKDGPPTSAAGDVEETWLGGMKGVMVGGLVVVDYGWG